MTKQHCEKRTCDLCGEQTEKDMLFGNSPFLGWVSTETLKKDSIRPAGYFERLDFCCVEHCIEYLTAQLGKGIKGQTDTTTWEWRWKMDWCKKNGIPPADGFEKAESEWEKFCLGKGKIDRVQLPEDFDTYR
jgi:hypothetical protein